MSGRRVLVVGPYPPTRDPVGAAVLDDVRSRRRAGDVVEVCSPDPSAAHHCVDLTTPGGVLAFGKLASGFDRVVVHHRDDLVEPSGPARRRALTARLWPVVLRRLHDLEVIEYGPQAARGVVSTALAARAGSVAPGVARRSAAPTAVEAWPDDVTGVQDLVRTRAAASRDRVARDVGAQLRAVPPLRLPVPTSGRLGITTVRRVLQRLVGWELDPVVGQVNRLRGAVLARDTGGTRTPEPPDQDASASATPSA